MAVDEVDKAKEERRGKADLVTVGDNGEQGNCGFVDARPVNSYDYGEDTRRCLRKGNYERVRGLI